MESVDKGLEVKGWWENDMFRAGRTVIEELLEVVSGSDASIFLFTEDDQVTRKGATAWAPRGNVVFEYGMFAAAQGRENAVMAKLGNPAMPADLAGIIPIKLEKAGDEDSFIQSNFGEVEKWIKPVKENHELRLRFPAVPPVSQISNEYLRSFGASIVGSTEKAMRHLIHQACIPQLEREYWDSLIRTELDNLKNGDALWAICGAKNYELKDVCRYMNENIELARSGGYVHRLYVAPNGEFDDEELEVIETHLAWAEELGDNFKVGVLVGKEDCERLLELKLPDRFGLVLTRHGAQPWKAHVHYPDPQDKKRQVGWLFDEEAIVLKLRMLFEDIAWKAQRDGVPAAVNDAIKDRLYRSGYMRKELLWRCTDERRPI